MNLSQTQIAAAGPAWRAWTEYVALKTEQPELSIAAAQRILCARGHTLRGCAALWKIAQRGQSALAQGRDVVLGDFAPDGRGRHHPTADVRDPISLALSMETFRQKLEALYIGTMGASSEYMASGRRTGNMSLTLSRIAEEPECPEVLRPVLAAGKQPIALRRYLRKRFLPEIEARLRGARHYQLSGLLSRRSPHGQLPDGTRVELGAGSIVEFDDMSLNHPYYVADGHGAWILTRQGLYARDVASKRWLGFDLIARPRESYRSEDVLRFFRKLMTDYGRFDCLRLERGVWHSRAIRGWSITAAGDLGTEMVWETPGIDDREMERIELGLAQIGVRIQYTQHAHQKGLLEGGFRQWQQVFGTYALDNVRIGAHRGEWEAAAKRLRQARAGRNPGELAFLSMAEAAEINERTMRRLNRDGADQRWDQLHALRPLPCITRDQCHVFLPSLRETVVDGGMVSLVSEGERQDFRAEFMGSLGHGYAVAVRWDPSEPTLGAAIYNRMLPSNPANFNGWEVGAFLGWADWEMPGPQIRLTAEEAVGLRPADVQPADDIGDSTRRRQQKLQFSMYRSLPRVGGQAVRRSDARDGRSVVQVAHNTVEQMPSPARGLGRGSVSAGGVRAMALSADEDPELRELLAEVR